MRFAPSKKASTAMMLAIFMASWIRPIWPIEQALQSSLTLVAFIFLYQYTRKNPITDFDFFLLAVFISAHSIAARWLYSNVPYDLWIQEISGFSLNQKLGWSRNNFDRLVHFLYGFCLTPAITAHVTKKFNIKQSMGFFIAVSAIMLTSLWYEWFEWLIALTLSPHDAEAYNGQQGDMWDAHKDMLMATIGSLVWFRGCSKKST